MRKPAYLIAVSVLLKVLSPSAQASPDSYDRANALDPAHEYRLRESVPGAYRSPMGAQVHPICFEYAAREGISRGDAEARVEAAFQKSFEAVVGDCGSRYPELLPYLREWIMQARRTVFTCSKKSSSELNFGGITYEIGIAVALGLDHEETVGIHTGSALVSLSRKLKNTVGLPKDVFLKMAKFSGDDDELIQTIVHEVFHATHANNRVDHDRIERTAPTDENVCGDNPTLDRVSVIASLCTGGRLNSAQAKASIELTKRVARCGFETGCKALFKDAIPESPITFYDLSGGISEQAASRVCERIYNDGECDAHRAFNGPKLTNSIPAVVEMGKRLKTRMDELFPPGAAEHEISASVLAALPNVRTSLEALKSNHCASAAFAFKPDGALLLKGEDSLWLNSEFGMMNRSLSHHFRKTIGIAETAIMHAPACAEIDDAVPVLRALHALTAELYPAVESRMANYTAARARGALEADYVHPLGAEDMKFRNLLGPELFDQYVEALNLYHYKSPKFSCFMAGFRERDTAEFAFGALEKFEKNPVTGCFYKDTAVPVVDTRGPIRLDKSVP